MVQSRATTVEQYLGELTAERRSALDHLLELARLRFPGLRESIRYGMIYLEAEGGMGVAFASQARYVSVYGLGPVFEEFAPRLKGSDQGKNCLRFARTSAIDWELLDAMFRALGRSKPALPTARRR